MDLVLAGLVADPDVAIDAWISEWHRTPGTVPLHEFLGFTWDEYARWAANPSTLSGIVSSRLS